MSGFEVVGVVLGLWPVLAATVKTCKALKAGRPAASLARKLQTEELIFYEFVHILLASDVSDAEIIKLIEQGTASPAAGGWKDPDLHNKLSKRLGEKKTKNIVDTVQEMDNLLRNVDAELSKLIAGMESMGSIRTAFRTARIALSQKSFEERLERLHDLNQDLNRLFKSQVPAPKSNAEAKKARVPTNFLHRDSIAVEELYEILSGSYDCKCSEPHIASLGFFCSSCGSPYELSQGTCNSAQEHEWKPELVLQRQTRPELARTLSLRQMSSSSEAVITDVVTGHDRARSISQESLDSVADSSDLAPPVQKAKRKSFSLSVSAGSPKIDGLQLTKSLCSLVESMPEKSLSDQPSPIIALIEHNSKNYTVSVNDTSTTVSQDIVCLEERFGHESSWSLLRKDRMILALRLSTVVLQFYQTRWIDEAWSWQSFCASEDSESNQISHLLVKKLFYSVHLSEQSNQKKQQSYGTISCFGEPLLTRLGLKLTELALGRTLQETREKVLKQPTLTEQSIDAEDLDFMTAIQVLRSGLIADSESQCYEDVVRACLKLQYNDRLKAGFKVLNSDDPSFYGNLEESILFPLHGACSQSWAGV